MRHLLPEMAHRFETSHLGALPSLISNRLIGYGASTVVGVFLPIFLFEFFGTNATIYFLFLLVLYSLRIPTFVLAAKTFEHIGLKVAMTIGTIAWAIYYGLIAFLDQVGSWPLVTLGLAAVSLTIIVTFYWAPFHTDFATFSKKGKRGREVSIMAAAKFVIGVGGPLLGGWLISIHSYGLAFLVGIVLVLASLVPLLFIPQVKTKYEFGFFESFKELFSKRERPMLISMFANGAESVVSYAVWPVFLFLVLDGRYLDIGIFTSLIVVINILLQLFVGKAIDTKKSSKKLLKFGVDLYALGWLFKAFVSSVGGVFAAATFHGFGGIVMRTPLDVMMYEKAADAGHYIDEFTVLREVAISFGRVAILSAMVVLSLWFSVQAAFILAAVASLFISLFSRYQVEKLVHRG